MTFKNKQKCLITGIKNIIVKNVIRSIQQVISEESNYHIKKPINSTGIVSLRPAVLNSLDYLNSFLSRVLVEFIRFRFGLGEMVPDVENLVVLYKKFEEISNLSQEKSTKKVEPNSPKRTISRRIVPNKPEPLPKPNNYKLIKGGRQLSWKIIYDKSLMQLFRQDYSIKQMRSVLSLKHYSCSQITLEFTTIKLCQIIRRGLEVLREEIGRKDCDEMLDYFMGYPKRIIEEGREVKEFMYGILKSRSDEGDIKKGVQLLNQLMSENKKVNDPSMIVLDEITSSQEERS